MQSLFVFPVLATNPQRKGCYSLVCFPQTPIFGKSCVAKPGCVEEEAALTPSGARHHTAFGTRGCWHMSGICDGYNSLRFLDHPLIALLFFLLYLEIASWFYTQIIAGVRNLQNLLASKTMLIQ